MPHTEVVQNGVVIVKPDARMQRALRIAQQFLGRVALAARSASGKAVPGLRSLIRHELILRWLHRELHDFAVKSRYRGKAVYIALDEKILAGTKDLTALVRENAKRFVPARHLEDGMRRAFSLIARERIRGEVRKKTKKQAQAHREPWQRRVQK